MDAGDGSGGSEMNEDQQSEALAVLLEYVERYGATDRAKAFFRNLNNARTQSESANDTGRLRDCGP